MAREQFTVVRAGGTGGRWVVRKGDETYGEYLCEASAIQDAVEAAQDAGARGEEAQVLVDDGVGSPRIEWTFGYDFCPPDAVPG
jgi:hypothetical protein